ncbi:MAG: exopolyphosphatase [Sphingomonadales bacterium]|nr:exopolyphosphatase [Sphingomonadales bacterium]
MHALSAPASIARTRRAIIDVGSNTVRLVIYDGPARAPIVLYNEKITARLGKGVADTGRLSKKACEAALAALSRYALLLELHGIDDIECVATAAVRDAANGAAFLEQVSRLGLHPRLLTGEEEALASAHGVQAAFPGAVGVVGDLGGGSLELIDIGPDGCRHGVSLPLGTLRLPALKAGGRDGFARAVRKALRQSGWQGEAGQTFYLVGGSWRALARYAMVRDNWPVDDPHGHELDPQAALRLARWLAAAARGKAAGKAAGKLPARNAAAASLGELARLGLGLSASRLASLPDAAALLAVLVRELKPARLVISGWGLREGLLAQRLPTEVAGDDPLLAGVSEFVRLSGEELPEAAATVVRWCRCIDLGTGKPGRPALRLAATMLALASMQNEPNLRAELASEWALRKRWIGIDAEGRAMLAVAVRANSARTAIPEELLRMAPAGALREALAWGLAVRLCRRMSVGAPAALAGTALAIDGGRLVLAARGAMAALHTDMVAKDHRLLAECLGLEPAFVALDAGEALPGVDFPL